MTRARHTGRQELPVTRQAHRHRSRLQAIVFSQAYGLSVAPSPRRGAGSPRLSRRRPLQARGRRGRRPRPGWRPGFAEPFVGRAQRPACRTSPTTVPRVPSIRRASTGRAACHSRGIDRSRSASTGPRTESGTRRSGASSPDHPGTPITALTPSAYQSRFDESWPRRATSDHHHRVTGAMIDEQPGQ